MAGKAITLYCAGTSYDSTSGDIIAWLAGRTSGERGRDWLFFPGPGSGESMKTALPGVRSAGASLAGVALGPLVGATQFGRDTARAVGERVVQGVDTATGISMDDTTAAAVQALRAIAPPGTTFNMAGWSRGAVTCVKLAHALNADPVLGTCPVNLFLFDPVPGPRKLNSFNWTDDLKVLRRNIARLEVVLMEDDHWTGDSQGAFMAPLVDPFTACSAGACGEVPRERIRVHPLPGAHSSAVEKSQDDPRYSESSDIGAHLCTTFLRGNGTPVAADRVLQPMVLLERYAALKFRVKYGNARNQDSVRTQLVPNTERDSYFYVNAHHRELFGQLFPSIVRLLDARFNVASWSQAAASEAARMKSSAPASARLVAAGLFGFMVQSQGPLNTFGRPRPTKDQPDLERLLKALM